MYSIIDASENVSSHLEMLKHQGVSTVIRYVYSGMTSKVIRPAEARLFAAKAMKLGLVYEGGGDQPGAFSNAMGKRDAGFCIDYLPSIGAPPDAMIWFAVDYDATASDIADRIIPYFQGIHAAMIRSKYRIGVYGSGAVGYRIASLNKLADLSWLAQSTGWWGSRQADEWALKQMMPSRMYGFDCDPDVLADRKPNIGDFIPFAPAAPLVAAAEPAAKVGFFKRIFGG